MGWGFVVLGSGLDVVLEPIVVIFVPVQLCWHPVGFVWV